MCCGVSSGDCLGASDGPSPTFIQRHCRAPTYLPRRREREGPAGNARRGGSASSGHALGRFQTDDSHADANDTSAGARVGFWKMSVKIVHDAPLFGHGTGSTQVMLAQSAVADPTAPTGATNLHNQVLATAIPLGLFGVALLLAMWIAHFRMFLLPGHAAWIGISVVAQNFVGSLFNSHLFDFAQGWLYVFGVGIAGGAMLRKHEGRIDHVPASSLGLSRG